MGMFSLGGGEGPSQAPDHKKIPRKQPFAICGKLTTTQESSQTQDVHEYARTHSSRFIKTLPPTNWQFGCAAPYVLYSRVYLRGSSLLLTDSGSENLRAIHRGADPIE